MNKNCLGKIRYCFLLIVLSFFVVKAQSQGFYNTTNWRFSNPKQFGFTVFDVDYFDNNNVIAVGSDGGIAKSTDGGTNWTYGPFTFINPAGVLTKPSFNDVHFITASVAYAVGNSGAMAKTIDGGATWTFVNTPLFANSKNINSCWFLNANKGYIGGDVNNTPDSLPKLYFTLNGGTTWDSIAAPPVNGVSRVGYISNSFIPSVLWPVDAKLKSIYSIQFINDSTGYVCGSSAGGVTLFPNVSLRATSATVCTPLTTFLTSGSFSASLLWKFKSGVLTDYSLSKERLGYTGINVNTPYNCTSAYASISPISQTYKAMNIINDSTVVVMSSNNYCVVKINTGKNDSTANVNAPGVFEKGKYQILNFPSPPTAGPNAGPSIPLVQVLLPSNPYHMLRSSNGTLVVGSGSTNFGPGFLWTSVDTGRNWVQRNVYPQNQNWSQSVGAPAIDFAPNGKLLAMGNNGIVGDSSSGGSWNSNYISIPLSSSYNDMEFADCNNGMAVGGGGITVTTDGGKTWVDKTNGALNALFANITSVTYPQINKAYFTTNIGTIYRSINQGTNLTPAFIDNYGGTSLINDLAAVGTDSLWACGLQQSSVATAQRFGLVYRSFNNGSTWDTVKVGPIGATGAPNVTFVSWKGIEFPSRNIGYICGNKGAVYKTIDAGATWINISPFPSINISPTGYANSAVSYTDIQALDNNTVFVVGNMFTATNNRRIYKTTDGGANWVDISGNADAISPVGNLNGILMHDANNGYVVTPGGVLLTTNNGGATWTLDLAPTNCIFVTMAFAPKAVPAGTPMANRKLFVTGANISGSPLMEYGDTTKLKVGSAEAITLSCSNTAEGSIIINASGGIPPYTYSVNGGTFQSSNTFIGLTPGNKTITIKDAACGSFTKTVTVGVKPSPLVNAGPDKITVEGDVVFLDGSGIPNPVSIDWSPNTTLINGNTYTPSAKPSVTTNYTLSVKDVNGCTGTDNALITVIPYCLKIMDAFTPNGDGINDKWIVTNNGGTCTSQVYATVFNRYGSIVYKNDNYNNNWDGTYNGKPVADGTYYYTITYKLVNGRTGVLKGDVTILR